MFKKEYKLKVKEQDDLFQRPLKRALNALDALTDIPIKITLENGFTASITIPNQGTLREDSKESTPARVLFFLERTSKGLTSERFPPSIADISTAAIGLCSDIANTAIRINEQYIFPELKKQGLKDDSEMRRITGVDIPESRLIGSNGKNILESTKDAMEKVCQYVEEHPNKLRKKMAEQFFISVF